MFVPWQSNKKSIDVISASVYSDPIKELKKKIPIQSDENIALQSIKKHKYYIH